MSDHIRGVFIFFFLVGVGEVGGVPESFSHPRYLAHLSVKGTIKTNVFFFSVFSGKNYENITHIYLYDFLVFISTWMELFNM